MELALPDRPAWTEVVGILVACALVFVVIAKLDRAAADRAADRARAAAPAVATSSEPARASGPAASGVALAGGGVAETAARTHPATATARTDRGSVALFTLAATGALMAVAGAALLGANRR